MLAEHPAPKRLLAAPGAGVGHWRWVPPKPVTEVLQMRAWVPIGLNACLPAPILIFLLATISAQLETEGRPFPRSGLATDLSSDISLTVGA